VGEKITDMLVAVLNTCSKEELEDIEEDNITIPVSPIVDESVERRKVIKNKIMAVGRMARVFALLREESEKVSELKSVSGSSRLPYGMLASGSEGIKEAITGFEDARKSDIENERLPPDLYDADSEEGKAIMSSGSSTPDERDPFNPPPNGATELIQGINTNVPSALAQPLSPLSTPTTPTTPTSPGGTFRRGHSRQASLGTTMTSPSTRRRSLESTMSLIQNVWDGRDLKEKDEVDEVGERLAGLSTSPSPGTDASAGARSAANVSKAPR